MDASKQPGDASLDEAKRSIAHTLLRLVWDAGTIPETFEFEYEGGTWEVSVRLKNTEDAPIEHDFLEDLPE